MTDSLEIRRGFADRAGLDGTHGLGVHASLPEAQPRRRSGKKVEAIWK